MYKLYHFVLTLLSPPPALDKYCVSFIFESPVITILGTRIKSVFLFTGLNPYYLKLPIYENKNMEHCLSSTYSLFKSVFIKLLSSDSIDLL